eukprot:TRINITY_DN4551_c0_g1_i1.p1 TRINITY_DN4551_c0_g1~~TRINITY_DN4551_c0_g1_i1.p1  ORF type:complete len:148 (-),score=20.62 TRINITY_DN4551_c0_g1_i1:20-433(-)
MSGIRQHAFRLTKGADLKQSLWTYVKEHCLSAAIVSCCVGSLTHLKIRLAGAKTFLDLNESMEIVSLTGTLCATGCHLHISVAKKSGEVVGGHLLDGSLVDTTAEIVLTELPEYTFSREMSADTGFLELVVNKNDTQ